jgi:hypothetical protein
MIVKFWHADRASSSKSLNFSVGEKIKEFLFDLSLKKIQHSTLGLPISSKRKVVAINLNIIGNFEYNFLQPVPSSSAGSSMGSPPSSSATEM